MTNGGKYALITLRTCGRDTPGNNSGSHFREVRIFYTLTLDTSPGLYTLGPVCKRPDQGGPPLKRSESDICLPQDKQPAPLPPSELPTPILAPDAAPDAAPSKSPEMQGQLSHAEQVAAELSSMAAILSQVQNKESADAAAEQLAPSLSRLRWLSIKGDESSGGAIATALLTMLRQEGQQAFSELMSQVTRLAFQDFYGSEAL